PLLPPVTTAVRPARLISIQASFAFSDDLPGAPLVDREQATALVMKSQKRHHDRTTGVVAKQLEIAGYGDIKFERVDAEVLVGKDLDDAVAFQLDLGPAGEVYREAGKLAEERHDEIANALKAELARFQRPNGIMMDSSSWKVTARNPG